MSSLEQNRSKTSLVIAAFAVVIGVGVESTKLLTYSTSTKLAELLGSTPAEFPGDHGGFMGAPIEFADALRRVLAG